MTRILDGLDLDFRTLTDAPYPEHKLFGGKSIYVCPAGHPVSVERRHEQCPTCGRLKPFYFLFEYKEAVQRMREKRDAIRR